MNDFKEMHGKGASLKAKKQQFGQRRLSSRSKEESKELEGGKQEEEGNFACLAQGLLLLCRATPSALSVAVSLQICRLLRRHYCCCCCLFLPLLVEAHSLLTGETVLASIASLLALRNNSNSYHISTLVSRQTRQQRLVLYHSTAGPSLQRNSVSLGNSTSRYHQEDNESIQVY